VRLPKVGLSPHLEGRDCLDVALFQRRSLGEPRVGGRCARRRTFSSRRRALPSPAPPHRLLLKALFMLVPKPCSTNWSCASEPPVLTTGVFLLLFVWDSGDVAHATRNLTGTSRRTRGNDRVRRSDEKACRCRGFCLPCERRPLQSPDARDGARTTRSIRRRLAVFPRARGRSRAAPARTAPRAVALLRAFRSSAIAGAAYAESNG
jgi:hypothetical protein